LLRRRRDKGRKSKGGIFRIASFGKVAKSIIAAAFGRLKIDMRRLDLTMGTFWYSLSFRVAEKSRVLQKHVCGLCWPAKEYVQYMYCGLFMLLPPSMFSISVTWLDEKKSRDFNTEFKI